VSLQTMIQLKLGGCVVEKPTQLDGEVVYIDRFGNLITNISRAAFERFARRFPQCRLSIRIARRAPIFARSTYAEASPGGPVAIFGSFDLLEVAVRDGNAASHFNGKLGMPVQILAAASTTTSR
jgi:S-adenosyl-L-methionine hydrolase (adenosine-forming)